LLEVMGRDYVMDFCIVSFRKQQEEQAFKVYVTDALKIIAENTSRFAGGSHMSKRYYELISTRPSEPVSSAQVISRIRNKIGGEHK
jgi:hypothetical protein